jgi:periplasmic protein TonB
MSSIRAALGGSAALHVAALTTIVTLASRSITTLIPDAPAPRIVVAPIDVTHIVFVAPLLAAASPRGGGGGGGNRHAEPIRRAQGPGDDDITLRTRRTAPTTGMLPAPDVIAPAVVLDARSLGSGGPEQIGLPVGGVPSGDSLGPGSGGGVGTGTGTGIGSGRGPGIGPGSGGGIGGGVYRPGGSVSSPLLLHRVDPKYTSDALLNRVQGTVWLDVVVTAAGEAVQIRVSRSLFPSLDAEAIAAVQQWQFAPGRLGGVPVNVAVVVAIDFRMQ